MCFSFVLPQQTEMTYKVLGSNISAANLQLMVAENSPLGQRSLNWAQSSGFNPSCVSYLDFSYPIYKMKESDLVGLWF